jgi:hypothetical protein
MKSSQSRLDLILWKLEFRRRRLVLETLFDWLGWAH